MSEEFDVLKLVCINLEQAAIPYMLTGSFAANFYTVPRMTRDIDIVIEILLIDVEKVLNTFKKEFYIDKDSIFEAVNYQTMFNIIHNDTIFKVDFIIRKETTYRKTEFLRKRRIFVGDVGIWIVAPEDLIISKMFWAKDSLSEMQIKDVRGLLQSLKDLDKDYIEKWVKHLKLEHIYTKVEVHA